MSCKSLFRNFEADYKKELNDAFAEIKKEAELKKEEKENEDVIKEIKDLIEKNKK